MGRYTGPRVRIIRRLGLLPGLTLKSSKERNRSPGEHGKNLFAKRNRPSLSEDYKQRLLEKQKLRFNYGVSEKQLLRYYNIAKMRKGVTGNILLELLEARLDCIIYRLGFALTIPAARQLVTHGHILVNSKKVTIPSFSCQKNDLISIKDNSKAKPLILKNSDFQEQQRKLIQRRMKLVNVIRLRCYSLLPSHLEVNRTTLRGKVLSPIKRKDVLLRIKESKVIAYYSR